MFDPPYIVEDLMTNRRINSIISNWIYRYQFFLQIKQDILQGRLPVSFDLAAELGAYVVQCKLLSFRIRKTVHLRVPAHTLLSCARYALKHHLSYGGKRIKH